ncbi:unnamed protein product [Heligmosomoides polygyrus]|uniref:Protein kinase domain-containing protein n=1 Tax=Heligmosomoides polygyrus TaxID=6339 RepID=A0A3P8AFY6_HELPZ|nr:unnamed protein product [Heligmosomoides polygyrus]
MTVYSGGPDVSTFRPLQALGPLIQILRSTNKGIRSPVLDDQLGRKFIGRSRLLKRTERRNVRILMKRGHSECSEVWSIGCMLYCMLIGKPPFESDSLEETYARIQAGQYSYPLWAKISDEARDLINAYSIVEVSIFTVYLNSYFATLARL